MPDRIPTNYYHFLMLMVSQLRTIDYVPEKIFINLSKYIFKPTNFALEIFRLLFPNTTIIEATTCPEGCRSLEPHYNVNFERADGNQKEYEYLNTLFSPHIDAYKPTKTYSSKIYLSREDSSLRKIVNEDEVVKILEQNGFEKIVLTGMPVLEQISIFRNADIVVGGHGANLTNLIFSRPGTKVIEITSDYMSKNSRHYVLESLHLVHRFFLYTTAVEDGTREWDRHIIVNNPEAILNMI